MQLDDILHDSVFATTVLTLKQDKVATCHYSGNIVGTVYTIKRNVDI